MTTTSAKKTPPKKEAEAPAEPESPPDTTEITFDGLRAVDTSYDADGNPTGTSVRDTTFAEQVAHVAPQILEQAIGLVPHAKAGAFELDGAVLTLTLRP